MSTTDPTFMVPAPPPPPDRKADVVADEILQTIVAGEVRPGDLLMREEDLAERFGCTRGVVREAMRALEAQRLVRPGKRRGTEVLDPIASLTPAVLKAMLAPRRGRVDPDALRDVLEMRRHLDSLMNGVAAERRTDEDLAALDAIVARLEEAFTEPRRYGAVMDELGHAIARATKNRVFEMLVHWHLQVVEGIQDLLLLVRFPTPPQLQGVRALVEAIRARDVETATELARTFHAWANARLMEAVGAPVERPKPPPPPPPAEGKRRK